MKLLQLINDMTNIQMQLYENSGSLTNALYSIINSNTQLSEDNAHLVAKVMVLWSIVKDDAIKLQSSLTYDIVCTIIKKILTTSNNHSDVSNNMVIIANQVQGDPKNITKMKRYIDKLARLIDSKVAYKIKIMHIASQLLHKHENPEFKKQLLAML